MRFPLPDRASPEAVAAGINPGLASWLPLQARLAEAGKLTTVLILGVTGISGFLAAQNARLLGAARVVGPGRGRAGPGPRLRVGPVAETAFAALGRRGLCEDTADIRYVQIGALAGPEAAVPSAVLRSRKLTISGSGAGSVPAAEIKAWTTSAESGPRVVLVRD
jgi:hypothetical protein